MEGRLADTMSTDRPDRAPVSETGEALDAALRRIDERLKVVEGKQDDAVGDAARNRGLVGKLNAALARSDEAGVLTILRSGVDINACDRDKQRGNPR